MRSLARSARTETSADKRAKVGAEESAKINKVGKPPCRPVRAAANAEARLYQAVFDSVMCQRLPPGTKLPEVALCELFAVNRSVVRKVLQRLAHEHIVQLRPNRGAIVAMPTQEETGQLFEARRALEAAILQLVIEHASKADLAALRQQLQQEQQAMHRLKQPAWARLASSFHLQLGALARNPILERYLIEILSRCSLTVALHQPPGNAACEHDEHARIVECIAKRDLPGALKLMEMHLRDLEQHLALDHRSQSQGLAQLLGLKPACSTAAR